MAEIDPITPDSIPSLIYVDKMGNQGGYRTDLLNEKTHEHMKSFIFCSTCDGISRRPQISDGKTFCTDCIGIGGKVDGRVDEFVRQLQCRCPLSSRGCDWSGKLGSIENHLDDCDKVNSKCRQGCGEVLQKFDIIEHDNVCPFRIQECDYCRLKVQASKANEHIRLCQKHPDGEVTCPYKEVGCDTIGIKRKNLDDYLTKMLIDHQKLLLRELNQLRDKIEKKEFETTDKLEYLKIRDSIRSKSIWILLTLVVMCAAILLPFLLMERDKIHLNELSIKSNKQSIQLHEQSIQSNKVSIQSNNHSIQSLVLMSTTKYITDYIADRDKTLHGIEWTYRYVKDESLFGPIFYLGACKLRIVCYLWTRSSEKFGSDYYVKRLNGDYDDEINTCIITYIHLYNVDLEDNRKFNVEYANVEVLPTVDNNYIMTLYNEVSKPATIRIYLDI
ncbi:TRAF-type zinc finger [Oopsacas minuta]|uniref:TRAF-type zinc finger n=1 Tax=Oopsacas minuta TaxID=111878 RepID=A0AAV7JM96_9METZ|nr:TRAF-type zinc finger [Oopsacas minuta]